MTNGNRENIPCRGWNYVEVEDLGKDVLPGERIKRHVSGVDHDGKSNHVGIVESRDGTTVYWNWSEKFFKQIKYIRKDWLISFGMYSINSKLN